ncbi:lipase [Trametes polyzona]|nr:lipase [Trametes polyzona]
MSTASRRFLLRNALALLGLSHLASAAPTANATDLFRRQPITPLSAAQIASFTPFTHYAGAAYCGTSTWTCGVHCEANPTFQLIASGGDGDDVQFWFVGFDPTLNTVVVSHEGTNPDKLLPLLVDADIVKVNLNARLFPGVSSAVEVHRGFVDAQAGTASQILGAVRDAMGSFDTNNVALTGHSLGAAISLLDAIFFHVQIPTAKVTFIGYGLPRVGNEAFANYVDAQAISVTHINCREDLIPIVPGLFLGFHHPTGEVHIQDSGAWVACPGQDNESGKCSTGDVPNIFEGVVADHDGPYNGIEIGALHCSG